MARTMEKIIPVKITTDEVQCYATEMRSNISATIAAARRGDTKQVKVYLQLKNMANAKFDEMVMRHLSEIADNPAKG